MTTLSWTGIAMTLFLLLGCPNNSPTCLINEWSLMNIYWQNIYSWLYIILFLVNWYTFCVIECCLNLYICWIDMGHTMSSNLLCRDLVYVTWHMEEILWLMLIGLKILLSCDWWITFGYSLSSLDGRFMTSSFHSECKGNLSLTSHQSQRCHNHYINIFDSIYLLI